MPCSSPLTSEPAHTSKGARFAAAEGPDVKMPVTSETGLANERVIAGRSGGVPPVAHPFDGSRRRLRRFRASSGVVRAPCQQARSSGPPARDPRSGARGATRPSVEDTGKCDERASSRWPWGVRIEPCRPTAERSRTAPRAPIAHVHEHVRHMCVPQGHEAGHTHHGRPLRGPVATAWPKCRELQPMEVGADLVVANPRCTRPSRIDSLLVERSRDATPSRGQLPAVNEP